MTKICEYCGFPAPLVPDGQVYSRGGFGKMVYFCQPCNAWVGVHRGTTTPLGRMAGPELRRLKVQDHALFDPLWRAAMKHRGWHKVKARGRAYRWLALSLGIPAERCHIGMFDEAMCNRAIGVCMARKQLTPTDLDGGEDGVA